MIRPIGQVNNEAIFKIGSKTINPAMAKDRGKFLLIILKLVKELLE